ncbi:hypothetical protein B0H13DRAFT_1902691 [Mycena leptocephala]|nr:hypothetical protein B0H13DRAFT_1902691 [Mycena leptocephala]
MSDLDWQNNGEIGVRGQLGRESDLAVHNKAIPLAEMDPLSQKNIGVNASPVVEAKHQKDCRIDTRTSGDIAESGPRSQDYDRAFGQNRMWSRVDAESEWSEGLDQITSVALPRCEWKGMGDAEFSRSRRSYRIATESGEAKKKLFRCHEWWILDRSLKAVHETKESKKYGHMDKKTNTAEERKLWNQESKIHRQIDAGKKPVEERKSCEPMEQESKNHGQIDAGTKPVEERKNCKAVEPREQEINGQIDAGTKPVEERKKIARQWNQESKRSTGRSTREQSRWRNGKAVRQWNQQSKIHGQVDAETKMVEERKCCEVMEPREQDTQTDRRGNKDGGGTEELRRQGIQRARYAETKMVEPEGTEKLRCNGAKRERYTGQSDRLTRKRRNEDGRSRNWSLEMPAARSWNQESNIDCHIDAETETVEERKLWTFGNARLPVARWNQKSKMHGHIDAEPRVEERKLETNKFGIMAVEARGICYEREDKELVQWRVYEMFGYRSRWTEYGY